jgi:acyl carrier protein
MYAQADSIIQTIREAIAGAHEIQVYAILLAAPGSVPKTSSGKLQRRRCREAYLKGKLATVREWQSAGWRSDEWKASGKPDVDAPLRPQSLEDVRDWLRLTIGACLKADSSRIDLTKPLAALGLDSLSAVEIAHRLETELGALFSGSELFQYASVTLLAAEVFSRMSSAAQAVPSVLTDTAADHPMSYDQRSLFFLSQLESTGPAYNLARAARLAGALDIPVLVQAFQTLVERHAALRTTFLVDNGTPVQRVHRRMEMSYHEENISASSGSELDEYLIIDPTETRLIAIRRPGALAGRTSHRLRFLVASGVHE